MKPKPLLSVLITSHNQGALLERCVNSILTQRLPIEYEIVISDDNSSDETWEIARNFAKSYPMIYAIQCNTDDYRPVNSCQRCGWNQCNAYWNSRGKYFAHIDADDFFCEGTEVLKKQVELLESHPQCSCCMANNYRMNDGEDMDNASLDNPHPFKTGSVLSSKEYIRNYWKVDHAFVYRRYNHEDPTELFGGYYDDTLITDYHVQFGDIVCLNDAGYVYVQHEKSIWNEVIANREHIVLGCHSLYIPILIPFWKKTMYRSARCFCGVLSVIDWLLSGERMSDGNLAYLKSLPGHAKLIELVNKELTLVERLYLNTLKWNVKVLKHVSFEPFHWIFSFLMRPV